MGSWLSSIVNVVNCLTFFADRESKQLCHECRDELIKEIKNIRLLIKRQQLAAILIIISPRIHRWIYRMSKER